jgi:hypothetical protein
MEEKKNSNQGNENSQGNAIKTDYLVIRDNIMEWGNTMIQLSNVCSISTLTFVQKNPFPMYSLILVAVGLLGMQFSTATGIVILGLGIVWIYLWWNKNNNPDKTETLNITMNSGTVFGFLFKDEVFKMRVLRVLEGIIADGGKRKIGDINIDINNCDIKGDLSFMNGREW